jgi:hypothetical protein
MQTAVSKLFSLAITITLLVSCRKDPGSTQPLKIVKKVAASSFDYVQYEYNAKGHVSRYVSKWKDATGNEHSQNNTFKYDANSQLVKWSSEEGYGLYTYRNGRLSQSDHFTVNGRKISRRIYTFNAANRLTDIVEEMTNPLPNEPKNTKESFQYDNNGNLSRIDFAFRNELTDPFTVNFSKKFVQYDNKKNPEPDGILGAFLPGVILQFNNPVRIENITASGTVQGYSRYEYNYNTEGFPLQRKQYIAINNIEEPPIFFTYEYE